MTASKNLVLILVAVAIAAAGYVLSGGAGEGPSGLGSWETVERTNGVGAGDGLTGPGRGESPREILATPVRDVEIPAGTEPGSGTTVVYPLEVELTLLLSGEVDVPDDVMSIGADATAGLEGSLTGEGGGPILGEVEFIYGPNTGRVLQANERGRFGASDLLQGASIVKVTCPGGKVAVREVVLAQLSTAELHLTFESLAIVAGTVTDASGAPLQSVEVQSDGRVAYTDADGIFRFNGLPAGKVLVTARAPGFATTRRVVGVGFRQRVRPGEFKIALSEGATLEIGLSRSLGSISPGYAILMPAAGAGASAIPGGGFPWYEVNPVAIPRGGRAVVEGLPLGAVSVRVFKDGALAVPPSKNVRLEADLEQPKKNVVMIDLEPAPVIEGLVLDGGEPVKNASVVVEAADRTTVSSKVLGQRSPRATLDLVMPSVPAAYQELRTDGRGQFKFSPHPDAPTAYYVTATSKDGSRRGIGVVPRDGKDVTIALGDAAVLSGELEVELPGRFQGLPVELQVQGAPQGDRELGAGADLVFEDLERGTWRVNASWRGIEVVPGVVVEVGEKPVSVRGTLPSGAIQGQTAEERRRVRGS